MFPPPHPPTGYWYVSPLGSYGADCVTIETACRSIQAAVDKAASGNTIYVAEGTYTVGIDEVVYIQKSITLSGGWNADFTAQTGRSVVDGQATKRPVYIVSGAIVIIDRVTIRNGSAPASVWGTDFGYRGGGIYNSGTLTITNSIIENNTAKDSGGGIYNIGNLTISDTVVRNNQANRYGGGIVNYAQQVNIIRTSFEQNSAHYGGAISNSYGGRVTIEASSFQSNSAD